ncbi:hypothetical protein H2198_004984 [Neophaeococcomyces mojaviensis]|uniref:Uncharacterized protein n=1 Tax=Neophaeococcomyces mojaviensis TaxID=3383035 RepID=A0ACC3A7G1_9EURO|nr:hypothetical protein H2198_004984 [Knufia sp. JES_112]
MKAFIAVLPLVLRYAEAIPRPQSQSERYSSEVTASVTATSASAPPTSTPSTTAQNPCAAISQIYAQANTSITNIRVPAQLAYDCLNDVPLDSASAVPWLNTLKPYIEWQSTIAYLKNPPKGYLEPAVDVWGGLQAIIDRVSNGKYANEYQLEFDIYRLFQSTHDGHFRYLPSLAGGVFAFGRPISLVSYSVDGTEAPKPYVYSDVLSYFVNGSAVPSPVRSIDGQNAVAYLENWAQYGSLQDPDALYNNVFYELGQASLGASGSGAGTFAGGGRGAYIFPGNTTTLGFENGTSATFSNFARLLVPFRNITNGTVLYNTWINPYATRTSGAGGNVAAATNSSTPTSSTTVVSSSTRTATGTPRPGYPSPVISQRNNYVGGWYLTEAGYEDVAVLGVQSFVGTTDFQSVVYDFLDQASRAGKTKLVIDVSANGGGTILQGYNLFKNLFPAILPYGATRFRHHETFDIIGETVSERIYYYPYNYTNPPNPVWQDFAGGTPFNYRADVDVNYENFDSWRDKDPPNTIYGDQFTSIIRWNLSDPTNTPANGVQVNGYGNRTGLPPTQPFKPENIVILYDGYCASTCAIFSEMMTQQGGIKTISIGGRPNQGPMQTVGGVKGTNNYPWTFIYQLVSDTYELAPDQAGYFNSTSLYDYINPATYEIPYLRAVANSGQVNVRDGIRQGDTSQTPLQFVYEAANCRLYYTAEMTVDVTSMWEKVVDVAWGGDKCVQGSVGASGKAGNAKREEMEARSNERMKKRMLEMTLDKAAALEESLGLFTDVSGIEVQHGMMLP